MEDVKLFYELGSNGNRLKDYVEQRLLEKVSESSFESIIEVGCGDGHFLESFSGKKKLGLDINPEMINLAKKKGIESLLVDITDREQISRVPFKSAVISSNYVFTEIKSKNLRKGFKNLYDLLEEGGRLHFTITNPEERYRKEFPGYKLEFDQQDFDPEGIDIPFKVLFENHKGNYIDVGIRDYHIPLEMYDQLLKGVGFSEINKEFIYAGLDYPVAVMYSTIRKDN